MLKDKGKSLFLATIFILLGTVSVYGILQLPNQQIDSHSFETSPRTITTPISLLATIPTTSTTSPVSIPPTTVRYDRIEARIDKVNTDELKLGRVSYAYITITNTGNIPITKERIEIIAGRDFGFPIGYQSRILVQDFSDEIGLNHATILKKEFSLPTYESFVYLGGIYDVSMRIYANDNYVDDWEGKVPLYP